MLLAVPVHQWLMKSLFAYDVIGFQTNTDVINFQRCRQREYRRPDRAATARSRLTAAPSSRAPSRSASTWRLRRHGAHAPEAEEAIERLNRRSLARSHIVGVDRLDYTKGLPERMKAFRRLLELYPDKQKTVTLMQIAPPTREEVAAYTDIREELEQLSGSINGEYGDFDWTPVRYMHRNVSRERLAALFRGSRGRAGDAAPRRHESGRQGIYRGPG